MLHIILTQQSSNKPVMMFLNQLVSIEPYDSGSKVVATRGSFNVNETLEKIDSMIHKAKQEKPNERYLKEA